MNIEELKAMPVVTVEQIDLIRSAAKELASYIDKANWQLKQERNDFGNEIEYHDYQTPYELEELASKMESRAIEMGQSK